MTTYEVTPTHGKRTCRYCPMCLQPVYKFSAGEPGERVEIIECRQHGRLRRRETLNSRDAHLKRQQWGWRKGA